jgi:hypothetical protein
MNGILYADLALELGVAVTSGFTYGIGVGWLPAPYIVKHRRYFSAQDADVIRKYFADKRRAKTIKYQRAVKGSVK